MYVFCPTSYVINVSLASHLNDSNDEKKVCMCFAHTTFLSPSLSEYVEYLRCTKYITLMNKIF